MIVDSEQLGRVIWLGWQIKIAHHDVIMSHVTWSISV